MAGTDQYDFPELKIDKPIRQVSDLLEQKVEKWELAMGRKLSGEEVMLLNDGIWSGIKYVREYLY